jgi:nucleotide-binding universal stress UspA family protein
MSTMKLLVGVDGSDSSKRAVEWCAQHAPQLGGDVVVVHAIEQPVIVAPVTTGFALPEFKPADREALLRIVTEEWCAPLAAASVPFRVVLKDGGPALTLIQVAETENADLVITGRRGRGGFAELLLGSTSHALSHHLHRPMLIVP